MIITNYEEYCLITRLRTMGGMQKIFKFENNYGASLVSGYGTYGLEMAVIKFHGKELDEWELCYDTPITDDVLGYLCPNEVNKYLKKIKRLKK